MTNFETFFKKLTAHHLPHEWQLKLASDNVCGNRIIRIPTGLGKTLGIFASWLWHRVRNEDESWPRRLIWCLPMRVLVEQVQQEVGDGLQRLGLLWEDGDHLGKVGLHLLMGGADSGEWHLYPEWCAVLIGTQDMLLSRAMNRAYASPRARWPMEFGLFNQDCLWVMDEVQLMDVGLATSAQLQAFRDDDLASGKSLRPCYTWWTSATLQRNWLMKSPDTFTMANGMEQTAIPADRRNGHLWDDVSKPCRMEVIRSVKELTQIVAREHFGTKQNTRGITLVIVNTVDRALLVYEALCKNQRVKSDDVDVRLVHSRFRPAERASWWGDFLNRAACTAESNRIIVATQVVEAGVDISASLLITELAPWASLVQRFGRCARWGEDGRVIIVDLSPKDDKAAAPYSKGEIDGAREALSQLNDVSPFHLELFEEVHSALLPRLYPFDPQHLLLRRELDELFDTTSDLSGADVDISRFIRSGEERDVQVFWAEVALEKHPAPDLRPSHEALCSVPFLKARDWLCGKETADAKAPRLKKDMRAWVWEWLNGRWRAAERRDLYPGQTIVVEANCGGYRKDSGWTSESNEFVLPVKALDLNLAEFADATQDDEALSVLEWQTIAVHGRETGSLAKEIARGLSPLYACLYEIAGRWHDVGKVHPAFNNSIVGENRPRRYDLAKAPKQAWLPVRSLYPMGNGRRRSGFRHEVASVLLLIEVLKRHNPDHPALLGPWRALLAGTETSQKTKLWSVSLPNPLEEEILQLSADDFNLLAYLVCAHHGKVRLTWHASPAEQDVTDSSPCIRGLLDGDLLPAVLLADSNRSFHTLPATHIDLAPAGAGLNPRTGPSWTERVLRLLSKHGPFTLAWLEALMRAADQRASHISVQDELLGQEVKL